MSGLFFLGRIEMKKFKPYVPAIATNLLQGWREKFNYVPASELAEIKAKHQFYRSLGKDNEKDKA